MMKTELMILMNARSILHNLPSKLPATVLAALLPLMLAGCGSTATGGGTLKNSASLAPISQPSTNVANLKVKPAGAAANKKAAMAAKQLAGPSIKSDPKDVATKVEKTSVTPIITAKADAPPAPVRRPYRKVRRKKAPAVLAKASKVKKKLAAKPTPKPVIVKQVMAKKVEVPMVPKQVIPAQIVPTGTPQDIVDAFNETPETDSEADTEAQSQPEPEKVAKAAPSFGGADDHRFSGR